MKLHNHPVAVLRFGSFGESSLDYVNERESPIAEISPSLLEDFDDLQLLHDNSKMIDRVTERRKTTQLITPRLRHRNTQPMVSMVVET